jgi:hypothetical protein
VTANRVPATPRALQRAEARRQNRTGSSDWRAARAMHRGTGHRVRTRGRCARCSCQGLKPPRSMGQFSLAVDSSTRHYRKVADNKRHRFSRTGARVYSLVQDVLVIAEFGQWSSPGQIQDPRSTIGVGLTCTRVPTLALPRRDAGRPVPARPDRKNALLASSYVGDVSVRRDLLPRPLIVNLAANDSLGSR